MFDDGDERTLGRNCVCPQGAKHFNEEWVRVFIVNECTMYMFKYTSYIYSTVDFIR